MKTPVHIASIVLALTLCVGAIMSASAQRRITPVDPSPGTKGTPKETPVTPADDPSRLQEQRDSKGNIILVDTITGKEWIDTTLVNKQTRMIYPRIYCVAAGINIWDPALRIFGQQYGIGSVWGELNMHNRYFPTLELGLGQADITPEGMNYTFKSPVAPFFKIGASYNVFYNSDPRYKFLVGLRYGFSAFSYEVTDVTVSDSYWGTDETFSIPSQNATVGYLDVLAGVRVNLAGNISVGWDLRFHKILHENNPRYGKPMYIPGFGKRGATLSGSFSLIYTFTLNRPASPEVNNGSNITNRETKQ